MKDPDKVDVTCLLKTPIFKLLDECELIEEIDRYFYLWCWLDMLKTIYEEVGISQQIKLCNKIEEVDNLLKYEETSQNSFNKYPKKLIPLQREVNVAILLLYELFNRYNVKYNVDLKGIKAWIKIVSGEFTSEYIKTISDTKKSILLDGNEKLEKTDFLEKYRKRFK